MKKAQKGAEKWVEEGWRAAPAPKMRPLEGQMRSTSSAGGPTKIFSSRCASMTESLSLLRVSGSSNQSSSNRLHPNSMRPSLVSYLKELTLRTTVYIYEYITLYKDNLL